MCRTLHAAIDMKQFTCDVTCTRRAQERHQTSKVVRFAIKADWNVLICEGLALLQRQKHAPNLFGIETPRRAAMAMRAPSSASIAADALPRPRQAPVTKQHLPFNCRSMTLPYMMPDQLDYTAWHALPPVRSMALGKRFAGEYLSDIRLLWLVQAINTG